MGQFIDITDLEGKYQELDLVRLSRDDGTTETMINTDVVNSAIEEAESIIRMYLISRYKLPFSVVPNVVKRIAKQLTYYILAERKGLNRDNLQVMYENDISMLKSINRGELPLDTNVGENEFQQGETINGHVKIENDKDFEEINIKGII